MTDILLWLIVLELTAGLVLGGYVLYEIQTALAVIVLHECADTPDPTVIEPHALTPEILAAEPTPPAEDDTDTIGTFTGHAWK